MFRSYSLSVLRQSHQDITTAKGGGVLRFPKKSVDKVERILSEMKAGTRDSAEFWLDMEVDGKPEKVLIQYFALRDTTGKFLGCLECSQKVGHIQSIRGQKRLLD